MAAVELQESVISKNAKKSQKKNFATRSYFHDRRIFQFNCAIKTGIATSVRERIRFRLDTRVGIMVT